MAEPIHKTESEKLDLINTEKQQTTKEQKRGRNKIYTKQWKKIPSKITGVCLHLMIILNVK